MSPPNAKSGKSLRPAIGWILFGVAYVTGLSFYKDAVLDRFSQQALQSLKPRHQAVLNLFQASFYFYYDQQFLPGVRDALAETSDLKRIRIVSSAGKLLFDSEHPGKSEPKDFGDKQVITRLAATDPTELRSGFDVQILMPSGDYGILYTFDGSALRRHVWLVLVIGLLAGLVLSAALSAISEWAVPRPSLGHMWGLRSKFLLTIVLINLITGGIVFFTLSKLQTREQTQRIDHESQLFAQFSTEKVIADFSNFFYFYYADKFLPAIRGIISTNENLIGISIINKRTDVVLFDSEQASTGPVPREITGPAHSWVPDDVEDELRSRDFAIRRIKRDGDDLVAITNLYKNENQESLFYVRYLFSYHSLTQSIGGIRRQILLDLLPSMLLGLLVAAIFSQLLISPIRRLVAALKRVTGGDYEVSVAQQSGDEIGELVKTFNTMAGELRKKSELRKYLSDATYRQVMEGPDSPTGTQIGGSRVTATVLMTDIRDFVSYCESLDAEEVTAMLNEYFSVMVEVVYRHGGEVDKFIGDALLAVFYGPSSASSALQAVYCALEMRERLADYNDKRRSANKPVIEIGAGITHGELISGPIGYKDRMDFTVIGDVVNLASRIEKLSKDGKHTKIVFSQQVEVLVRGLLDYEEMTHAKIRGKSEDVSVYELIRIRDLQSLVQNLRGSDIELRRRSVDLLGHSRNPDALPFVLEALQEKDEELRLRAVLAASRLAPQGHAQTLDILFESLASEKSIRVISAIISSLGKLCTTTRILEIANYLKSSDERVVANAVEAIGQIRDPKCSDMLLPMVGSRNNRIKANAAMALFAAGHFEVIDILKPMLMHSDPLMRSSAAFAIGELTILAERKQLIEEWKTRGIEIKAFLGELQEAVPMLVSLLKDSESMVKRQAVVALGKIKDRSAVLALINNVDLDKDSQEMIQEIAEALRAIGSHKLVREIISRLQP